MPFRACRAGLQADTGRLVSPTVQRDELMDRQAAAHYVPALVPGRGSPLLPEKDRAEQGRACFETVMLASPHPVGQPVPGDWEIMSRVLGLKFPDVSNGICCTLPDGVGEDGAKYFRGISSFFLLFYSCLVLGQEVSIREPSTRCFPPRPSPPPLRMVVNDEVSVPHGSEKDMPRTGKRRGLSGGWQQS